MADGVFFSFADKVSQAKLAGVHLQLFGDHVRMRVDREGRRHGSRTAVIAAGDRIGVNLEKLESGVVDPILAAGVMPCGQRRVGLECAVGAAGMNRAERARHDPAIAVYAAADGDHRRVRGITRGQFLRVGHDQFNGSSRLPGEKVDNR